MWSHTTIYACVDKHLFLFLMQKPRRRHWGRCNDFPCIQSQWWVPRSGSKRHLNPCSKYRLRRPGQTQLWNVIVLTILTNIRNGVKNVKASAIHFFGTLISDLWTRPNSLYKPCKGEIPSKEAGCRKYVLMPSWIVWYPHCFSGRCDISTNDETTQRTNARRISPTKQNPFPSEPSGNRYKGTAQRTVFSVVSFASFNSVLLWFFADIPIYTKSVSFPRRKTLHLWNSWTKGVQLWQKRRFTITSWMARTKSKLVLSFTSCLLFWC